MDNITLPAVVGAALVDSLNPCAFALLLVFVATVLALAQHHNTGETVARRWLLSRGGVYVFGIFVTYLILGMGLFGAVGFAATLSGTHVVSRIAAVFALLLGVMALQEALLPEFGVRLSGHMDRPRLQRMVSPLNIAGLFGAGVLVGLCTVPCSGSVYLAVLALLSAQTTLLQGVAYLVLYNIVFVLPLVVILALVSSKPMYRRIARWQMHRRVYLKLATATMSIGVGLLTFAVV